MANKKTTKKRRAKNSGFSKNLLTLLTNSVLGKFVLFTFFLALFISINILISKNAFDKFVLLLGAQILALTIISWIVYLFKRNK